MLGKLLSPQQYLNEQLILAIAGFELKDVNTPGCNPVICPNCCDAHGMLLIVFKGDDKPSVKGDNILLFNLCPICLHALPERPPFLHE